MRGDARARARARAVRAGRNQRLLESCPPFSTAFWRLATVQYSSSSEKEEGGGLGRRSGVGVVGHWSAAAAAARLPLQMLKEKMGRERVKKKESGRCGRRAQ